MSANVGVAVCVAGGVEAGIDFEDEAKASHAAFSSSSLEQISTGCHIRIESDGRTVRALLLIAEAPLGSSRFED